MPTSHTLLLTHPIEKKNINLDFLAMRKAQLIYRALNNNIRQRILYLLDANTKMTVTVLTDEMRIEQPVVSQHLGVLRKAQLVTCSRSGKYIWYSVNYEQVEKVVQITDALLKK